MNKGDRVKLSDAGIAHLYGWQESKGRSLHGTVASTPRDPQGCVCVVWDGTKSQRSYLGTFIEPVGGETPDA